ncbi:MAG: hypothetical protein GY711_29335 [bacterium]|nr:hypothetical protein [bacterium]
MNIVTELSLIRAGFAVTLVLPSFGQWSTESLSQARYALTATTVHNKAVFLGGRHGGAGTYSNVVDIYDAATRTWSTHGLPQGRYAVAATNVDNFAFFAGGRRAVVLFDRVDVYDATTDHWTTTTLSMPRYSLAATSVRSLAMFAGGATATIAVSRIDIYDTATTAWSTADLSTHRAELAATSVGDLAMFAGGNAGAGDVVDIYDAEADAWHTATLSAPRRGIVATSVGNVALFAGGSIGNAVSDVVDLYNASTGTWSAATLSVPRSQLAAVTVGYRAVFAGGRDSNSNRSDAVDVYDVLLDQWSTETLPHARYLLAGASVGGRALFAGGIDLDGVSEHVDIYAPSLGTPYCHPATANSTGFPATMSTNGSLFVDDNDLTLLAFDMPPGEFGYFLVGSNQGMFQPPGSQGILCLTCGFQGCAGIGRFNRANEIVQGPTGSLSVDLTALPLSPPAPVQPGDTWNFQCWYRDLASSNFTDAVSVTFL